MAQNKLKAPDAELAKDIESEQDLGALTQQQSKPSVETALNAEKDVYPSYEEHASQDRRTAGPQDRQ